MNAILRHGQAYGMTFNWDKLEVLGVNHVPNIVKPNGDQVKVVTSMISLGGQLCSDGMYSSEMRRRIDIAWGEFAALQRVWSHSRTSFEQKRQYFNIFIESKLMYGLSGIWLNKSEAARLDSFQVKALRHIYKIHHSYISHVSNLVFDPENIYSERIPSFTRRVGRPRITWVRVAFTLARSMVNTDSQLRSLLMQYSVSPKPWTRLINKFF